MNAIVPRWEWRTFGSRFDVAQARFAGLQPTGVQESDEIYLLAGGNGNVKIRDALMDIKILREVDSDGLQCWEPVMKQGFPLAAADARKVFAALDLVAPALERDAYTQNQFLDELIALGDAVRTVEVHKRRVRYEIGGCTSEVTEIEAAGKTTCSIAIEAEDAVAVVTAVASIGLGSCINIDYPHGLRALLAAAPERYAVIDVGTNSVKFHIAERTADGGMRALIDRAELTRLGEGLAESGEIGPTAVERTVAAISGMVDAAKQNEVRALVAVGTAGLRIARNSAAVTAMIRARTGVSIEVISGEEESRLAYLAVKEGLDIAANSLVVFETGGGSSQFTLEQDSQVVERFSVDVGAARYTERFDLDHAVSSAVLDEVSAALAADLARINHFPAPDALLAMGGALTNIAAVKHGLERYDPDIVHGTAIDRGEIDRQIESYRSRDATQRRAIKGLQPKRAEVILAGACIVRAVMEKLRQDELRVSDRGLRHGLVMERFGG
jgi:exopolyphosphatase/guanosine-5'-triphosphate,3'-diphosphate pyrophosphatase